MDLENLGASGGMGFITAILAAIGWNKKIDRMVDKDTCVKTHEAIETRLKSFDEDLKYIRSRIDKLIDTALNGKR